MSKPVCPVRGCGAPLPKGRLMCCYHWNTLPQPQRTAVNAAWRSVRSTPGALRQGAINTYLVVRDFAVATVEELEREGLP